MNPYADLDTLYDFLKDIKTIDEFFARKEPHFDDAQSRQIALAMIDDGTPPDAMLSILKSEERQRFVASRTMRRQPH